MQSRKLSSDSLTSGFSASALAASLLLALPGSEVAAAASESDAWREYARISVQGALSVSSDSALGGVDASEPPRTATFLQLAVDRLTLSVSASQASAPLLQGLPALGSVEFTSETPLARFEVESSRFSAASFSPQVRAQLGQDSQLRFGLTVASQRFATPGFGEVLASNQWLPQMGLRTGAGPVEQSFGQGVHLGFDSAFAEHFVVGVNLQSRVDMDTFKTYRGLFTEPGDFDMPARTGLSLGVRPSSNLALHVGAERVFYSEVAAFTTYALPTQLLALLGDGSAPVFAWRDLNVLSARAELEDLSGGRWGVEVTTRQQPSPTSQLFDLALRDIYSGNHWSATYQRSFGEASIFSVGASFAPAQYILGPNPFRSRYREGSQVEVELNWSVAF